MTQEEKELLLKDLCARLPYHPIFKLKDDTMPLYNINTFAGVIDCFPPIKIEDCRLYLRPMSSITKEEEEEFEELFIGYSISRDRNCVYHSTRGDLSLGIIDWLISNHFDFRGLIPMGLALEAPEGMYK